MWRTFSWEFYRVRRRWERSGGILVGLRLGVRFYTCGRAKNGGSENGARTPKLLAWKCQNWNCWRACDDFKCGVHCHGGFAAPFTVWEYGDAFWAKWRSASRKAFCLEMSKLGLFDVCATILKCGVHSLWVFRSAIHRLGERRWYLRWMIVFFTSLGCLSPMTPMVCLCPSPGAHHEKIPIFMSGWGI